MAGPSTTPQMGGLEALVAAAAAANTQVTGTGGRARRVSKNDSSNDTLSALTTLLSNPVFVQAFTNSSRPTQDSSNGYGHMPNGDGGAPDTPYQQTRSGRISRPPLQPLPNPFFHGLNGEQPMYLPNGQASHQVHLHPAQGGIHGLKHNPSFEENEWRQVDTLAEMGSAPPSRMISKRKLEDVQEMQNSVAELPAWPLPPSGPGGRRRMPKDELLARRRARNRLSASESRQKRRDKIEELSDKLKEREAAYDLLQTSCQGLERQIEQLQQVVMSAGLPLPQAIPATLYVPAREPVAANFGLQDLTTFAPSTTDPFDPGLSFPDSHSFDMFNFLDMDGEDDAEFIPPTSPQDSDGEEGGEGKQKAKMKGKGRKKKGDDDEEEDEEFEDDEVEDEDLFLPIEDVPVPPAAQMESAMRSLGVDNQDELARLINKMVTAGKEGMTPEMVEKLKVLLSLVGPHGTWSAGE